jgi:DNA-directed RNA polymerase specialized sigma24 family protein
MADPTSSSNVIELRRRPSAEPQLRGDEEQLFRRLHPELLRRTARRVVAPYAVVEEACSFAWLQFVLCQPERDHAAAWLTVVARHEAWRLAAQETASTIPSPVGARPWTGADLAEQVLDPRDTELMLDCQKALQALAGLPWRQRTAVSLHAAGYRYGEIAELTGTTYTWVNRHISEGRARLRRRAEGA